MYLDYPNIDLSDNLIVLIFVKENYFENIEYWIHI